MNHVSVFPEGGPKPALYTAVSGDRRAEGATAGDALNGVVAQMGDSPEAALVLVQPKRGDRFFSDEQIDRLRQLMAAWRAARDSGTEFPPDRLAELDALIAAELDANIERSKALLKQLPS